MRPILDDRSQRVKRRQQTSFALLCNTDVNGRWNHIITALTHVDVVVRVDLLA